MDSLLWLQNFHLIRPYWLLAFIPLALLIWLFQYQRLQSRSWSSVIDKKLLPHLLKSQSATQHKTPSVLLFLLGSLMIVALAGPAYEERPQAVYKAKSALVILLDLSRSMDATDIKPSRLNRARFKINDILKKRNEGQSALIVYAADAFVVSPLTEDAETIASQVPALETSIMPGQGSRLDLALQKAQSLFVNAGHTRGHILIITDSATERDIQKAEEIFAAGYSSSVLAIGSAEGAPISSPNGGFVKDNSGAIVVPKLDKTKLNKVSGIAGGRFSQLTANDRDINHLLGNLEIDKNINNATTDEDSQRFKTDIWHEEGPWLLLLLIPFAAYAFRKGLVFALLIFILPLPQPVAAADWNSLWKNNDQRAYDILQDGDAKQAAQLFKDPQWKAAAEYKAGNYEQAANLLSEIDNAEANYNRGNALAKGGQLEPALQAYEQALKQQPEHKDAKYNQQLVQQALQQQQQQDQQSDDAENSDSSQQNEQQQPSSQQSDESQQQDAQNSQSSQSDDAENQNAQQDQASQQDAEESSENDQQKSASQLQSESAEAEDQQNQQQLQPTDEKPDLDQQQTQQWLKKIPDDPGGLLRRKFQYQYSRQKPATEDEPW